MAVTGWDGGKKPVILKSMRVFPSTLLAIVILFVSCAGAPYDAVFSSGKGPGFTSIQEIQLDSFRVLRGGHPDGKWMALVFTKEENRLKISSPKRLPLESQHAPSFFQDENVFGVMSASPHDPIRFFAHQEQNVSGFFRTNGETHSMPDGRHDALGLDGDGMIHLLSPEHQKEWTEDAVGGFYALLVQGVPQQPVSVRDALCAIGWNDHEVFLFVAEGRDGKGLSYEEGGALLHTLGAMDALAMDGGGSARLMWREMGVLKSFPPRFAHRALPNFLLMTHEPLSLP